MDPLTPPTQDDERRALVRKLLERRGVRRGGAGAIEPRRASRAIPLSFPQQRLWFLHHLDPDASAYNLTAALRLSGPLRVDALEAALDGIVARHEALRMAFPTRDGEGVVTIAPSVPLGLAVVDLGDRDPAARATALDDAIAGQAHAPFDLEAPPLFRLRLVRLAPDEHVLVLTAHHIIFDGWSISLFVRELASRYREAAERGRAEPPALAIGYADYAVWQRDRLARGAFDDDVAYWTRQLAALPRLELPTDRPRPAVSSLRGSSRVFALDAALVARLRTIADGSDATLFMALASVFFALLGRYTGQDDIAIGSPVAGRSQPEIEGLLGLFANTLVLRADLSGAPTFRELVARVRRMTIDAFAHQDAPFEYLVERLQPERRLSQQPLFQVAFAMQHEGIGALALPGLEVRVIDVPSAASKFDLTLALTEERGAVSASIEYRDDLFDAATIDRLGRHYRALAEAAVAEPERPLERLAILPTDERRTIVETWGGGTGTAAVAELLHQTFERQAAARPGAAALTCGGESITYAELNARANRLASFLRRLGVVAEDLVGLYLGRSIETVVSILAVLKAGGAYVPIDPVNPSERVNLILQDAGARLLVTDGEHRPRVAGLALPIVVVDDMDAELAAQPAADVAAPGPAGRLAYVIYTSGSTGRPKGVLIQHDHVQRLLSSTASWFHFGPDDVWTLFHSYGFDFSVWEIWGALLYGGRLVVVPYLVSRSPDDVHALVADEGVTVLNQTPSAFRQFIDADAARERKLALRCVIFGGEALDLECLRPWFVRHGDEHPRLVNMYGITETTVHVTYRPIALADLDARAGSVIGRPIPDLRALVLDRHLEPVPPGVAGELCVGGAGVGRGYLHQAELTAERFVPDPFSPSGGRLYRSGDLARFKANGDLEYLGRIDHQVKVRGFRIEPGEIESALSADPTVRDAVVVADEGPSAVDRRLLAYVTPRGETAPAPAALRRRLQALLPDYMVPSAFVVLDALPLTPHGKLDRRALPRPTAGQPGTDEAWEAPRTDAERTLAGVWREVLGVERIGRRDNFFELGGDSIRSIKVLALARERGLALSLQQLFQHQAIAEIAAALSPATPTAPRSAAAPFALVSQEDREAIERRHGDAAVDAYPLTRLQEGMLFRGAFTDRSTAYHNVSSFHLRVAFDAAALRGAFDRLVSRHPVLRTSLHPTGFAEPLQIVHRHVATPLVVDDVRALARGGIDARIGAWLDEERGRRFEWSRAPLFRVHVHRRTDLEWQITLSEHHAILDGWSVATLLSEVMTDYLGAIGVVAPPAFEAPAAAFADHVRAEREAIGDAIARRFWTERLDDAVAAPLPRLAAAPRTEGVIVTQTTIAREVVTALEALAREVNVPFRSVLLAAHVDVVGRLGSQADVVTGLVVNARPEVSDGDRALGLFLNTLPLRVAAGDLTWRGLVARVFAEEMRALPHRAFPMAEIQRARGGAPVFHTAFNYVHFHAYDALARLDALELVNQTGAAETDLPLAASFSRDPATGAVGLSLECASRDLDRAAVERIAGYYTRTLEAMASRPDAPAPAWSPIEGREQDAIAAWSRGPRASVDARLAHELVAGHARRSPLSIAVETADSSLTYGALEARATAFAHRLRDLGVRPESRVALLSAASPDLVVAMLAVWKAGAAFVPLDPSYPAGRIRGMLREAAPVVTLFDRDLAALLEGDAGPRAALGDVLAEPPGPAGDLPAPDADRLAYVIFTSGSTGVPKGVMATHAGLRNLLHGQVPRFALEPSSRVLQFAAIGFDAAVSEIFTTLAAGATLVLAPRSELRAPDRVLAWLHDRAISTVTLPPAMLAALPDAPLPALRTVVSAGEACRGDLVRRWARGRRLVNAYGPTETTVCATMTDALGDDDATPPIGRPLDHLDAWVLDRGFMPVPAGVVGELFVGGDSLARGYIGRPDLTAERFVPHPLSEAPGARLYRTGDLARWRADGRLEFAGRADAQVKVRGVRIELGEIESVLQRHGGVRQAAVVLRAGGDGAPRLLAYVEPADRRPTVDALRAHLAASLPEHAVPAVITLLTALPLTPSGKIDRRALPDPSTTRPDLDVTFVAPRTPLETTLAGVWAGVLKIDRVGVRDNFFRLGGDSILSLQVVSRARAAAIRLSPQQLFEHQTIAELASVATADAPIATAGARPTGPVTLSPIQRWFFELDVPSPAHWNQALVVETPAAFDRAAFARAFAAVVGHHDAFRLRFVRSGTTWTQAYADESADAPVEAIDLSGVPGPERASALARHAARVQASLDLSAGPLACAALFHLGDGLPGRLLLVAHHLVVDGVSWRVLLDDLQLAYETARRGDRIALPAPGASFQTWTRALAARAASDDARRGAAFWRENARARAARLPCDCRRADGDNLEGDVAALETWLGERDTADLLHVVPPVYNTETPDVLIAGVAGALAAWTGAPSVRLALEGHGRDASGLDLDVSRTVGWFTSLYPVTIDAGGPEPGAAIKRVKEQLRAIPHRGASYGLLRYLAEDASVAEGPAPEISFNYLGQLDAALPAASSFRPASESAAAMRDPRARRPHLIDVVASIEGGRVRLTWLYASRLFERGTIERVASDAAARIAVMVAHCRDPKAGGYTPSDFPQMDFTPGELDALIDELGDRTGRA